MSMCSRIFDVKISQLVELTNFLVNLTKKTQLDTDCLGILNRWKMHSTRPTAT